MAIVLIEAKTITVDDEEALHRGVQEYEYYKDPSMFYHGPSDDFIDTDIAVKNIKCNRIITRHNRIRLDPLNMNYYEKDEEWAVLDPDMYGIVYAERKNSEVIGLSESVHEALGWTINYVTKLENQNYQMRQDMFTYKREIDLHKQLVNDVKEDINKLNSLPLWERIKKVFTGY